MKLVKGALLLFVVVGTIGGGIAGLLFGTNLGGNFGCLPFNAVINYESCANTYAIVGAGLGLILSLIIAFFIKKALAIALLVLLLALLLGSTTLPSLFAGWMKQVPSLTVPNITIPANLPTTLPNFR
ncbi:MAG: hypothetical protein U0514_04400 [Candidatus Andersenbacteria bacterium]